ncbi:hypothetical protein LV779_27475 [Streptomyces thinghirensis]|nr:hypothetical protein [Streptomyces thinghirensis]
MPDISLSGVRALLCHFALALFAAPLVRVVRDPCLHRAGPAARRDGRLGGHPVEHHGRGRRRHHRVGPGFPPTT